MPVAGTAAVTELWAKCKAWFGRKIEATRTTTTVSLQLKNNAGDALGSAASIAAASSSYAGVMTADMYSKLDGISTYASNGKATDSTYGHVKLSDATNGTSAASSGGTAATPKAVKDALDAAKSYADSIAVGAAAFQGTANANSTISNSSYKKGWYWVVGTAGTYVGQTCEAGDMVFAVADKGSSYSASNFSVVQNNIVEMTTAEVDAICV